MLALSTAAPPRTSDRADDDASASGRSQRDAASLRCRSSSLSCAMTLSKSAVGDDGGAAARPRIACTVSPDLRNVTCSSFGDAASPNFATTTMSSPVRKRLVGELVRAQIRERRQEIRDLRLIDVLRGGRLDCFQTSGRRAPRCGGVGVGDAPGAALGAGFSFAKLIRLAAVVNVDARAPRTTGTRRRPSTRSRRASSSASSSSAVSTREDQSGRDRSRA